MVDYCSSANVFAFLQLGTTSGFTGTDFTTNTTPSKTQVEEWIVEAEDKINRRTLNSWKSKTITKEYHTIKPPTRYYEGTKIFIGNRNITTLASGSGDKIEVWNGSEWEDYLVSRTEGRNKDYWVSEVDGILWLRTYPRILRRDNDVRLTYRFKEPSVPGDIKTACIRLTAITAIQSDDKSLLIPEGSQNIPLFEKTKIWKREASEIIQDNRELKNAIL